MLNVIPGTLISTPQTGSAKRPHATYPILPNFNHDCIVNTNRFIDEEWPDGRGFDSHSGHSFVR